MDFVKFIKQTLLKKVKIDLIGYTQYIYIEVCKKSSK